MGSNPFAKNAPKKPPVRPQEPKPVEEVTTPLVEPEVPAVEPTEAAEVNLVADVLSKAKAKKQKKAPGKSTYALYLSDETMKKVKAAAKRSGLSVSEIINQALSEVFK